MPRYKIIVNPTSGRGYATRCLPELEELLKRAGLDYDLVQTERPWHAVELAEQAARDGYEVVAVASGDGTANEALNGLMRARSAGFKKTAMSIIPVGTGNDFAYGVYMRGDLETSIKALSADRRITMDVGLVKGGDFPDGRYFGNGVGVGFDAVVGFVAARIRWTRGLLAYLIAVLQTVFIYFKAPTVRIQYEGKEIVQPSLMVSIMNGQRMGGGFFMAPNGKPDDNRLDLCIAEQAGRLRVFGLVPHFMKGDQETQKEIKMGQARQVTVTAVQGSLPAHCDGETLCKEGRQLTIELLPNQLEFVCQGPEA